MRSKASYDGHPFHTALIPFPFAFLTGAFVFDAAGWLFGWADWIATGGLYTVPPNSSGKKRATEHMLFNLSAVALMATALGMRLAALPIGIVVVVEAIAIALLLYGSSLGGVLVTRNQISIDHRYAEAGKWKEETVRATPGKPTHVAKVDELKPSQMKLLHVDGRRIVLAFTGERYVAFDDRCTHRGGSLAGGCMIAGVVQCPWHGSQFDTQTGGVSAGPASERIQTYRVESRDGKVYLTL
jgi:nitrite reductase/ring-hydroxylating ferredoxin subunit